MLRLLVLIASVMSLSSAPAEARSKENRQAEALAPARAALANDYDAIVAQLITITEIPAPPFAEEKRGAYMAKAFREHGLRDVAIDAVGNVTGIYPDRSGSIAGKLLVVSAHLDTVFPADTDVTVRREGDRLKAPGVGDDSLGLAAMLAWLRAMDTGNIQTDMPILFVATVGEEGRGDLRGVRHLMKQGDYAERIARFISVDGYMPQWLVHKAVGSKRYEIAFNGPGGHSYGAYGIVNPMVAMADAVQRLYQIVPSDDPRTTYSASVVFGGRSVNTIPDNIVLMVDMRSPDPEALAALEAQFLKIVDEAVVAENAARSTRAGEITIEKIRIGDRPPGETDKDDPLVKGAKAIMEASGYNAVISSSSTDSNIAMSMDVPAITIGTGGGGGRAHTLDEYISVERESFIKGLDTGLQIIIAATGDMS